ncbi:MAG: hypothetical protein ABSA69_03515 [Verrucomicrobiota bacterium]|jgi:hypothetical protein
MQKFSKVLIGLGILAGIVAVGLLIGWWGSRGPAPPPTPSVAIPTPVQSPDNRPPSVGAESNPPVETKAAANPAVVATNTTPTGGATNLLADWEDKLDEILGSDEDDTNKVKDLFAVFPRLPEEGQAEVAQHLSNLVPDDNYAPLGQLLQNTNLPDSVLDVLMSDVLNRPNSVKLPQLLQVTQNPDHPKADEAKDLIELYLDEDDPAKWPDKMQQWLKENPD